MTHKGELPGLWILRFMIFAALHPALLGQIKHMTYLEVMWLPSCQRLTLQKDQPEDKCSDSILLHDPLSMGCRVCLEENSEGTNIKEKKSLWDIRTYGLGTTCPSKTQLWRLTCKANASNLSHFKASVVKIFSSLSSSKTELGGIRVLTCFTTKMLMDLPVKSSQGTSYHSNTNNYYQLHNKYFLIFLFS